MNDSVPHPPLISYHDLDLVNSRMTPATVTLTTIPRDRGRGRGTIDQCQNLVICGGLASNMEVHPLDVGDHLDRRSSSHGQ